ncbi:hypothetical protein SAMN05421755_102532 [Nitrosomonas sp. Nm33]|uniref:hypothetical protein n=1 Tax=Nitrosomonas sp. Nm33 TaxID=133724 RepID=UPI00089529D1|nr:hypothetical protein [Nitrosomonas sp. Nm33]SDY48902.1 hypothetical protein SAMN05421755_102532 [Nitrosomonas sp. Nm33]
MALLIVLAFNHTLQYVVTRQQSIIQTKVVLLIAFAGAGSQTHYPGSQINDAGDIVWLGCHYLGCWYNLLVNA